MATLLITNLQGRTRTHRVEDETIILGRDPSCDVPIEDLGASRRHVAIRWEDGTHRLEDLGSKNGTLINDVPQRTAVLRSGDVILIGGVRVVYRDDIDIETRTTVVVAEGAPQEQPTVYGGGHDHLELSQRRLELLYEMTDRLTRLRDRDELLSDAMDVCCEMLRFERGAIAVKQPKGNLVDWPIVRNLRGKEGELTVSRTILGSALTHGERVIVNDTQASAIDPTVSMVQNNIRSAMCVPLLTGDRNLGVIYGDRVTSGTTYSKEDVDFLAGIARLVTTGLINAQLLDEQKLKLQLESEMAMARQIQTGLFPAALPARSDVRVAALNDPGNHVSGDYYDFIELPDGRLAFLIADVTGEGVSAALLMANLQAAVRMSVPAGRPLGDLLTEWNRLICRNTDASRFITCLIGAIDPKTRVLEFGVAGHHPPFLLRPGGVCDSLNVTPDYPLGVIDDAVFGTQTAQLDAGPCTIVGYTDGVNEAFNHEAEQYGTDRAARLLASQGRLDAKAAITKLREDVAQHAGATPQSDDITIIAVELT